MSNLVWSFTELCTGLGTLAICLSGLAMLCRLNSISGKLFFSAVCFIVLGTAGPAFLASFHPLILVGVAVALLLLLALKIKSLVRRWK